MKCKRCNGRVLLDRIFCDNKNFETSCLMCGDRQFINKETEFGKWLTQKEQVRQQAGSLVS